MRTTGTVLLSRQALRPCGKTRWIEKSVEAVSWLKKKELTLCSSVGVQTWELITALGSLNNLNLDLFVTADNEEEFKAISSRTLQQFDLDRSTVHFLPVLPQKPGTDKKAIWRLRDQYVANRAQYILPLSIRTGGHMETITNLNRSVGKTINSDFAVEYKPRRSPLAYTISKGDINLELDALEKDYLIHWTRTFNTAWPGERLIDFYRDILASSEYPRSAFHSLINILKTKVIRSSSDHMPGGALTVSFSNRAPSDMAELIAWRSRYRLMSFEPYGIGIEKSISSAMNILPVIYYDRTKGKTSFEIKAEESWKTQSTGKKADWTREDEYRHAGDVDISDIPVSKLILLCRTRAEAAEVSRFSGIKAISFTTN